MLKVTTESGRVYLVRGNEFMRCGDDRESLGQWYPNNVWTRLSYYTGLEVGEQAYFWQRGSFADPDLFQRTSPIASIEEVEDDVS